MFQENAPSITDWLIAGGSICTLFGVGAAYGSLKSDNKNVKDTLDAKDKAHKSAFAQHEELDNRRFEAITNKLDEFGNKMDKVHTAVTILITKEDLRARGIIKTRAEDEDGLHL